MGVRRCLQWQLITVGGPWLKANYRAELAGQGVIITPSHSLLGHITRPATHNILMDQISPTLSNWLSLQLVSPTLPCRNLSLLCWDISPGKYWEDFLQSRSELGVTSKLINKQLIDNVNLYLHEEGLWWSMPCPSWSSVWCRDGMSHQDRGRLPGQSTSAR